MGYRPKNYADFYQIDYVYGDLIDKKVKQVQCGFQHTVCITEDGEVYSWGNGKNGALGHGDWNELNSPKKVEGLKDIVKIECGGDFNICLDKDGNLYSWGSNRYGQLGITGTNTYKINQPHKLHLPHGITKVVDVSCGEEHAAILT